MSPQRSPTESIASPLPITILPDPTLPQWSLLALAAAGIGFSKSGFPGVSMMHVVVFALVFGSKASTGILLPMLIIGDLCAIAFFGRKAVWSQIGKLMPFTLAGIVVGWRMMGRLDETTFRLIVGGIILTLTAVQAYRMFGRGQTDASETPSGTAWPWAAGLGTLAGMTTMLANAAGPVVALYLLVVRLTKWELIGTSAWLFLVTNVIKLPFSYQLGLINGATLRTGAMLAPMVPLGMLAGRWLVQRISQRLFNIILLAFTAVMAARLAWG